VLVRIQSRAVVDGESASGNERQIREGQALCRARHVGSRVNLGTPTPRPLRFLRAVGRCVPVVVPLSRGVASHRPESESRSTDGSNRSN